MAMEKARFASEQLFALRACARVGDAVFLFVPAVLLLAYGWLILVRTGVLVGQTFASDFITVFC